MNELELVFGKDYKELDNLFQESQKLKYVKKEYKDIDWKNFDKNIEYQLYILPLLTEPERVLLRNSVEVLEFNYFVLNALLFIYNRLGINDTSNLIDSINLVEAIKDKDATTFSRITSNFPMLKNSKELEYLKDYYNFKKMNNEMEYEILATSPKGAMLITDKKTVAWIMPKMRRGDGTFTPGAKKALQQSSLSYTQYQKSGTRPVLFGETVKVWDKGVSSKRLYFFDKSYIEINWENVMPSGYYDRHRYAKGVRYSKVFVRAYGDVATDILLKLHSTAEGDSRASLFYNELPNTNNRIYYVGLADIESRTQRKDSEQKAAEIKEYLDFIKNEAVSIEDPEKKLLYDNYIVFVSEVIINNF